MAKWYRSIRVLPSLEPLGEWLEHQGMPVTKGPARRSSKRTAPDSGDEPWLLGALASRGPAASTAAAATAAASTSEPDEAAVAFPEYNPFTPIARIPVRQSSSSVPVHEAPGNLPQRLLAISPLMSVPARPGQLPLKITATAPAVRPAATTSPRQSLTQPPRRLSGGPTEMGGLYSIPIRRAVPVTGGGATGTECDLTTLTTAGMRKQQQEQQQQRTPEAEVGNLGPNEDEDVATLRWLFRQTGRNASQASAPAAAQPDLPSQPPARKSEAPIAPLKVQMSLRWPAPPAPRPAEAEEAPMAAAEAEPVLLRPTRRQRLLSTRSDEEVLVGVEDVSQRADELLPPPLSRRRPADAEGGGGGTVGASGSGVAPAEPPRRNVALLRTQTDVMRIGGLVSVGAISESGRTLPKKEQDDPAAAVAERALLHPYIHHAPSQKNLPYYQDSRRATTMDPPPSGSRGGGSGGSSSAFSAEAAATTGTPAVQSSALQQRHRYLETPPQLQRQGQLRVQLQFLRPDWERRKEVMQGEEGLWTEEEAEDQQERYHLYEWSQGHVPPPSLTGGQQQQQQQQQQQRYQQHLQQQYQQQPQQEAQRQIEQQQRAELEEYALRHRAMRRRRQQDRGSGDESHDDDAG
ncbi:hypothetical protein Vretimale_5815 [Volvox reticuliferus]|nr:hypothetical protein Vretimale_5815 [Volvox reticuliferus]